jgi:type IV pilus assembly protein PilB
MITNEELIVGINKGYESAELKKIAVRGGMRTLHQDSLEKVRDGMTTLEEALGTVPPDL